MKKIGRTLAVCLTASVLAVSSAVSASAAVFSDVSGHWAEATINRWVSLGYINGYPDGTFRPKEPITRTEFAVVANHAFNFQNTQAIHFPDVAQTFWGYTEIQKAYAAGYMRGDASGTFRPKAYVTRQEAAIMLANIQGLSVGGSAPYYSDSANISSWARSSVNAVSAAGYMSGYPDGSFRPKDQITRAEVVTMLNVALGNGGTTTNPYVPPSQSTTNSVQNMTLQNTTLRDTIVNGDLTIPSSMSTRSITLNNVTVRGKLNVEGGGTITAKDCVISELVMDKSSAVFHADDGTSVAKTTFRANGTLEGNRFQDVSIANSKVNTVTIDAEVENLTLDTDADMRLYGGAEIETFEITKNADDALIELSSGSLVRNMNIRSEVRIAGKGDIDNMTVYVSGVLSEIEPDSLSRRNGAGKPDFEWEYEGTRHESSGSGSSSSSGTNKTISKDFKGDGATYKNVTITDDADVEDMRVTGNLTIDKGVENGTVTLEDVRVDGNVYVYGGGGHSVIFRNCDIRGDIISDKDSSKSKSQVVALRFDSSTKVRGEIRIQNDTILDVYSGSPELSNVVVEERDVKLEVDIDIDTLTLEKRAEVNVKSGVTIDTLKVNRGIGKSTIDMDGSSRIKTVDARSDVEITGTGTVNKINKDSGINVSLGSGIKNEPDNSTSSGSVTSVTLNKTKADVEVGKTIPLSATVAAPDSTTDKTVTWSSSDEKIATVSTAGVVTGVAVGGPVTITATSKADNTKTATCQVTVAAEGTLQPDDPDDPNAPVTAPTLDPTAVSLKVGSTTTIRLRLPADDNDLNQKVINWSIASDGSVDAAKITGSGDLERLLKAEHEGTAKVTVTVEDNPSGRMDTLTCDVTVTPKTGEGSLLQGVRIGRSENGPVVENWNIGSSEKNFQLAAMLQPSDAEFSVIRWSTSDPNIVDLNLKEQEYNKRTYLEAKGGGTATITLTAVSLVEEGETPEEFTASCTITVTDNATNVPVTGVSVDPTSLTLKVNETKKLTETVAPANATNKAVEWSTENPAIATVDGNGNVTGKTAGFTRITVKADNNKTASCTVTVTAATETPSVKLNKNTLTLSVGGTETLTATTTPSNAQVTWSSNANNIASVENGRVEAKAAGTATITATIDGASDTCTVTVSEAGQVTITLPKTQTIGMLPMGKATLTPTTVTQGAQVTWSSNTETVATVDENSGEITAVNPGKTTITATASKDGKTATDTCEVTIKPGLELTYEGADENDTIPKAEPGGTIDFKIQVKPTNAGLDYGVVKKGTDTSAGWGDGKNLVSCSQIDSDGKATLTLTVPDTATTGDYTLNITAVPNGATGDTLKTEKSIDFEVIQKPGQAAEVTITPPENTTVVQGGTVVYTYTVDPENANVAFKYTVTHTEGGILEGTNWEENPVLDTNSKTITVTVPSDAPAGTYKLKVENDPLSAINATINPSELSFTVTDTDTGAGTGTETETPASTMSLRQDTAQTVQQQPSAPRTFSFIPQRELQSKPTTPVVTVEPEQKQEPVVKEPEEVQEPAEEPEKEQEPVKEPETTPEQTTEPEQKQGIALTCADSFKAGETLTLSGTVNGVSSALRKIDWSIKDAGTTGAAIRDGVMSAEQAGTVTVVATVQNSTTTEYFTITVLPGDEPKADEPTVQEPEQTPPAQMEPQNPAENGTQTGTPAEGVNPETPAEGQNPAVTAPVVQIGAVTLPNGQVIPNAKKYQRNLGMAIVLSTLDALPENAAADSVTWKVESVGATGAVLQIQDNTLVNVNAKGVILLSRTARVTDANGGTAIVTTYYEITII